MTKYPPSPKLASSTSETFAASDHALTTVTAARIATYLVQSKLDYCNSLYLNLPSCELDRLQLIQNTLARTVCNTRRFTHITPALKSLHWLKIRERIAYKVISLTYNALHTAKACLPCQTHHACLKVSALAENPRTHHLQSYLSHRPATLFKQQSRHILPNSSPLSHLAALGHPTLSRYHALLSPLAQKSSTAPSATLPPACGTVFLLTSVSLELLTPPHLRKQRSPSPNRLFTRT